MRNQVLRDHFLGSRLSFGKLKVFIDDPLLFAVAAIQAGWECTVACGTLRLVCDKILRLGEGGCNTLTNHFNSHTGLDPVSNLEKAILNTC